MNFKLLFTSLSPLILSFAMISCIVDDIVVPDSERVVPVDYRPFAEEGKIWVYGFTNHFFDSIPEQYRYQIVGDTLLGNRLYKKMYAREADKYNDTLMHYIGAVRDTLMKVLFVDADQRKERLLYDFGLQSENMMRWYGYTLMIGSQYSLIIEGKQRNALYVSTSNADFSVLWIEGIGLGGKYGYGYDPITKRICSLKQCFDMEGCCYDCKQRYVFL